MGFTESVVPKLNSYRNFISRELVKSGEGRESWFSFYPTEDRIEEIIQDSIIEAWRRWGEYDPDKSSLATWLGWIVKGRVLNFKKYHSRRKTEEIGLDTLSGGSTPLEEMEAEELFQGLSEEESIFLGLVAHSTDQEMAQLYNTTKGNIRLRKHRIKDKIDGH